jgi:hypothetical protein
MLCGLVVGYIQDDFMYLEEGCSVALPNAVEHVAKYTAKNPVNQLTYSQVP